PRPLLYGGAGVRSLDTEMPQDLPERLEAGTLPLPAIAGLLAGIRWVEAHGIDAIRSRTAALAKSFTSALGARFTVHGPADGSVVSFTHRILSPAEIGTALAEEGICVRTGFHCAPDAHHTLGTGPDGSVRVSFSAWNTAADVERILNVLHRLDEYSVNSLDFRRNS
ncbi:MAG: aminotransferase class V-fold PLP-dependent enzyme, partial [Clostridia bacterium]|nr:aminotransferase class V-fold PLP-dependent enzyme [Clostridia bacterium]